MQLIFNTAENLHRQREQDFLKLTPDERFRAFLTLLQILQGFVRKPVHKPGYFIITRHGTSF